MSEEKNGGWLTAEEREQKAKENFKHNARFIPVAAIVFVVAWNIIAYISAYMHGRDFTFSVFWSLIFPALLGAGIVTLIFISDYRTTKNTAARRK